MTCTNTRIQIRNLSNYTTDPQRAGEMMLKAAKANIKLTKKVLTANLHEGLHRRRVGTNKVEQVAMMLAEGNVRDENIVTKILQI